MTLKITKTATFEYWVNDGEKPVAFIYFHKCGEHVNSYVRLAGSTERTRLNYAFFADIKRNLAAIVNA